MRKTLLYAIIASVILLLTSFMYMGVIFEMLIWPFPNSLKLVVSEVNISGLPIKISLVIALIPLLLFVTWKFAGIQSLGKRFLTFLLVFTGIIIVLMMNTYRITSTFPSEVSTIYPMVYPIEDVHFDYAILVGTLIGCIVSILIFRLKKSNPA